MIKLNLKPSTNKFVAKSISEFVSWLKKNYDFPSAVHVNVTGANYIRNGVTGEKATATCYLPCSKYEVSEINISTGDFFEFVKAEGKDSAIYTIVHSICHEIQHYYQWIDDSTLNEEEADHGADEMTYEYIDFRGFLYE